MIASLTAFHAAQDIWICPSRDQRSQDMSKANNRYGTTIRTFDQATEQAAAKACMSVYHFSHAFKAKTGLSPIEFRNT